MKAMKTKMLIFVFLLGITDLFAQTLYVPRAIVKGKNASYYCSFENKLLVKVKEFINDSNVVVDEGRLLQEVALFADRINFTEELVRLSSHFIQFKTNLEVSEPIGRKLDFIVQEINRETNTIASKANDFTVANIIVELKSEIEKIREQIQNVE